VRVPAPHESLRQREFLALLTKGYGVTVEALGTERTPEGVEVGSVRLARAGFDPVGLHYVPEQTMHWITTTFYLHWFGIDPEAFARQVDAR